MSDNQLEDLPEETEQLTNLQRLDLSCRDYFDNYWSIGKWVRKMLGGDEISWANVVDKTDDGIEFCEGFYKRVCNKFRSQVIILTLPIYCARLRWLERSI